MYLLDTNVVSELYKAQKNGRADTNVVAWTGATPFFLQFVSAVTLLELELGVLQMERRDPTQGVKLRLWLERGVLPAFADRILAVDASVARRTAALHVPDRRSERDALIAATALVHDLVVVTRNVADFAPTGARILDPWQPPVQGSRHRTGRKPR